MYCVSVCLSALVLFLDKATDGEVVAGGRLGFSVLHCKPGKSLVVVSHQSVERAIFIISDRVLMVLCR